MIELKERRSQPEGMHQLLAKEIEELNFRLENLGRIGAMITSILDIDTILSVLLEVSLQIVDGEVGGILIMENGKLMPKIAMGLETEYTNEWRVKGRGSLLEILMAQNEVICLENAEDELETDNDKMNIRSLIAAPVSSKGDTIGAIVIANKTDGQRFGAKDVSNLATLIHFTAVAIDNAKLVQLKLEKQQMDHELYLAEQVQAALLPRKIVEIPGIVCNSTYIPARQIGGDYFDIIIKDEKHFAIVIGDVSSKGIPAALIMSAVRSMIRTEYRNGKPVDGIINSVNQLMCEDSERTGGRYVTLFYGHIDLNEMTFQFINAGHPPPFLIRRGNDELIMLNSPGTIVGQFPEFRFASGSVILKRGDRILFYTDGAFECFDSKGSMLGWRNFTEIIKKHKNLKPSEYLKQISVDLESYMFDKDKVDDTTLLVLDLMQ